jgi:predicted DNA-binding protein YlxM (UPF0122 family)
MEAIKQKRTRKVGIQASKVALKKHAATPHPITGKIPTTGKIDIERCILLRMKGNSLQDIADVFNVSKNAVSKCLERYMDSSFDVNVQTYKNLRADLLAVKQAQVLSHITHKKLLKSNAHQLSMIYGTLYDKERLETGLSTNNTAVILASAVINAHLEETPSSPLIEGEYESVDNPAV